ncbi:uncharacterized protein LOC143290897 [Babylonia areolata]|uniref:uncharacterized protein LOC143290897 n=1 Tax=Babylonia areolata TaxID=304850 RepID=UPI003FD3FAC2
MAESLKNSEQLSLTSSGLGSSCCDNDVDISSDVKDKSDDVISEAGSASLTIDSLEEEDTQVRPCGEVLTRSPTTNVQSEMLELSRNKDAFCLHEEKEQSAINDCKDQCKVSDLVVHSEIRAHQSLDLQAPKNGSDSHDRRSSDAQKTVTCETHLGTDDYQGTEEHTTPKREQAETKSLTSPVTQKDTPLVSKAQPHTKDNGSSKTNSPTSSTESEQPQVRTEGREEKVLLQKSRSLTDESSTDPSPKHSRRSGIPRRKNSTQSMVTVLSSGRNTPQNSPARVCRSLTLGSVGDCDLPAVSKWVASSPTTSSAKSFPPSPVRMPTKLRRTSSQSECCSAVAVSCAPLALSRDNVTSRLRFEIHHQDHGVAPEPTGVYLTPSQRKDLALKQLRAQVKDLRKQLQDKGQDIEDTRKIVEEAKTQECKELQEQVEEAQASAEAARKEVLSLQDSHAETTKKMALLQQQLDDVRKDMRNKLAESEEIFLEMYNKGRQSAIFEHEEEMELKRKGGRSQEATEKELYNKLVRTQAELAKWQTIQRHESYHTMPIPGTEAETTLRFLKDSVFHYLTTDKSASDEHLRAIVRILHFSEVQREKIAHAIIMKRNKTGW